MIGPLTLALLFGAVNGRLPPPCSSDIYCHGPLLHAIQMAELFRDSKTFVDMKMRRRSNETMAEFAALMNRTDNRPTVDELKEFVDGAFEPAGSEFEDWSPSDWKEDPYFLESINDRALKTWGSSLNELWKMLGRKMKDDVRENSDLYSIIYVPHPVIVPGGRFREFYYWDSYWIVRGLLLSEMTNTVKGMLENFISIVDRYGLIPNGGRVYYTMRSQPPLLIPMVDSYIKATNDVDFLRQNIDILEKEFHFWMANHTVTVDKDGKSYTLARYNDMSSGPRPESYREDYILAQGLPSEEEKDTFYSQIKSAAESGWDFSTRWFIMNGTNHGNLTNTKIKSILPVDLNSIIYWNADLLHEFNKKLNRTDKAKYFKEIADLWIEAVNEVLWHEEVGTWLDYDMLNQVKRDYFYPSNFAPLWTNCYDAEKKAYFVDHTLEYLKKSKVMVNQGGIPTTFSHSGEQWDYPNAWPPLQYIVIMGLDTTGDEYAKDLAFTMAERWIRSNFKAFNETRAMYEKYDATVVGGHGGGGEYEVQLGFGWTNGVVMELLHKYGDRLTASELFGKESLVNSASVGGVASSSHWAPLITIFLAQTTLTAGCIGAILYARRVTHQPDKTRYLRIPGAATF